MKVIGVVQLFHPTSLDPLYGLCKYFSSAAEGGEVCIVERLFSSSLVALVELSNPRKLRVCHFKVRLVTQYVGFFLSVNKINK